MKKSLVEFIVKRLDNVKKQRWIIPADELFVYCDLIAVLDDDDIMMDIMEYLEENQIDVNFHNNKSEGYYRRWNELERKIKLKSMLKGSKTEIQRMIERVNNIKIEDRPDWLEMYRNNDEPGEDVVYSGTPYQRITDMLTQELTERINNEPGLTIEELQQEVENEIMYRDNPIMGELNGVELINFLKNRIIPERFTENNNN